MDLTLRKITGLLKGHESGHGHGEIADQEVPTTDAYDESDEKHVETHRKKTRMISKRLHRGVF